MIFPVKGHNFLSQENIYCDKKSIPVSGRNFILKDKIARKKFPAAGRNLLSQDGMSLLFRTQKHLRDAVKKKNVI